MRVLRALVVLSVWWPLAGCRDDAVLAPSRAQPQLEVRPVSSALVLRNVSRDTLYYFAAPRSQLPVIDWVPCVRRPACKHLAPRESRAVSVTSLEGGIGPGESGNVTTRPEIAVYFWRATRDSLGRDVPEAPIHQVIARPAR